MSFIERSGLTRRLEDILDISIPDKSKENLPKTRTNRSGKEVRQRTEPKRTAKKT